MSEMHKAKTFLWGAFPASNLPRNGNNRAYWAAPIPKGTVIPDDCEFHDAEKERVLEWIDAKGTRGKKVKQDRDSRTKQLFGEGE